MGSKVDNPTLQIKHGEPSCLITDAVWDQHREKILQQLYHWSHLYKIIMMVLVSKQHKLIAKYKMQATPPFSLCVSREKKWSYKNAGQLGFAAGQVDFQVCTTCSCGNNVWGLSIIWTTSPIHFKIGLSQVCKSDELNQAELTLNPTKTFASIDLVQAISRSPGTSLSTLARPFL